MEYDVTIDRNKYIGGSDLPVIMGISPFKTRYELLLEKAEIMDSDFSGNKYTEYGKVLEPKIRDYINHKNNTNFQPNQVINGDIRCHTDGFNGVCVLEIKTTSHIYETVDEYMVYLVQLVKYMEENNVKNGMLAVYERPEDFNTEFEPARLQIYEINIADYKNLLEQVNDEIDRFREDLKRLKDNPLLTEQDFQPNELVLLSRNVLAIENQLSELKAIEQKAKEVKKTLFEAMERHGIKSWTTPNGTKITRVDEKPASVETVEVFDVDTFKAENSGLYNMYLKTIDKKISGRSGYVKITLPNT